MISIILVTSLQQQQQEITQEPAQDQQHIPDAFSRQLWDSNDDERIGEYYHIDDIYICPACNEFADNYIEFKEKHFHAPSFSCEMNKQQLYDQSMLIESLLILL